VNAGLVFRSPIGLIGLEAGPRGLRRIVLRPTRREARALRSLPSSPLVRRARVQLEAYFAGQRKRFDLPLDLSRGTAFQRAVWRACARIPYGRVRSYAGLATTARRPRAARAVGQAMRANPLPIVIPCHRVVASDGALGGYGAGLALKQKLLALEGVAQFPRCD